MIDTGLTDDVAGNAPDELKHRITSTFDWVTQPSTFCSQIGGSVKITEVDMVKDDGDNKCFRAVFETRVAPGMKNRPVMKFGSH